MIKIDLSLFEFDENTTPEMYQAKLVSAHRAMLSVLEKNVLLEGEKALLLQKLYGKSSEKKKRTGKLLETLDPLQQVFDEAVVNADDTSADTENEELTSEPISENADLDSAVSNAFLSEPIDKNTPASKRGRKRLPNHFIRENVIHDLSDAEKQCACGCQLSKIGEEVSEQLEVIPAQLKVLRHVRYKYACRGCEEGVKIAPVPAQPIPKGIPTAGLLSHVCVAKYDDHLPLYRQAEIWQRLGVDLSRSTLSSWVLQVGALLQPLIPLLQNHLVQSGYVKADETTTQVLREPGRAATSTSYMWLYMTGNSLNPAIVYEYQATRHGEHAVTFLKGFKGTLQTDGYSGYHSVTGSQDVISAGCFAHARRKFHDVWVILKKDGVASKALETIAKLYEIERWMQDQTLSSDQIKIYRQEKSKPICEAFQVWLLDLKPKVPPKSPLAKAIFYTLNQWEPLTCYLNDGHLSIDNNAAERQIRPFTIGRKNWLFMGSVAGAKAASVIYSLIETAKANGLNPTDYLKVVLEQIPTMSPGDSVAYSTLLPWNVTLQPTIDLSSQEKLGI